jgi:hypothetical protein
MDMDYSHTVETNSALVWREERDQCMEEFCVQDNNLVFFYVAVNTTTIRSFLEDNKFLFDDIHMLHVSAYA